MPEASQIAALEGRSIEVVGRVQGVGFRPFVQRLAKQLGLAGWVRNYSGHVQILVRGDRGSLDQFAMDLIAKAPAFARPQIESIVPTYTDEFDDFLIVESGSGGLSAVELAPDQSICEDCLAEIHDPTARRYRYPFANCTQCGPRYTIIRKLPYDRANTTMADFALCRRCRGEYADPNDRRFHAEPIACPDCGPRLRFVAADGDLAVENDDALAAAVDLLRRGLTVAVKGIGGYHLLCDATRESAVARLRQSKNRPHKPFAVMVPTDDKLAWRRLAAIDVVEEAALLDPSRPIVLVRKRPESPLAPAVASGMAYVGLMLPYSPLHHLLLDAFEKPVVATSANISGEPVLTDAADVERRLARCCDGFLHHDRAIERPADDPVVQVIAGQMKSLRLGRGTAPLTIKTPYLLPEPILACGGQLKTTVALAFGDRIVISPHIGDMGNMRSLRVFEQAANGLQSLYGTVARHIVHDAHPDFTSTRWTSRQRLKSAAIQHHLAHASALAGEHGREAPMLVFAWDGLGFGQDGTSWGGETLMGSPGRWRRVGTIRPIRLVGGDRVALEPWRSACSVCWEAGIDWGNHRPEFVDVRRVWETKSGTLETSAVGRLFDAAAALLGLAEAVSYDGHAPALVESIAGSLPDASPLPVLEAGDLRIMDWTPLVPLLLEAEVPVSRRAAAFHAALAATILADARYRRSVDGTNSVGLTGGVFQNRLLTERAVALLKCDGFEILLHERVPPNDGGLSFGQAVEFAARSAGT
ncbi:carbamoyltransferase HypF [Bradyrhizobium sp. BTAi1]|uniref:carbamoyltransferase HypF n=1 Tax=Bradyrhizobium sp. (strain BTAi1 / ATCC BAA-1182) TaxID=288000 RepID=UPI00005DF45F|nr:carbamoyltransferase HypF [Bradyrhizobium sp. BTAi1]ABQ39832.1 Carbamoyltransferase hypF [Bradyrhizobium sp. BTAi1]